MTIKDSFHQFVQKLLSLYSERETRQIADMVFENVTGLSRLDRITKSDISLDVKQQQKLEGMMTQLLGNMPVQYVLGEAWFYGLKLTVNKDVLIPRPETEELVKWIIDDLKKGKLLSKRKSKNPFTILDIGTGSGCIAVALKKNIPEIRMIAIDQSASALEIAKENAVSNQTDISFRESDITEPRQVINLPKVDIIVSNPPYIPESEKDELQSQVINFEPELALFVPDRDPLFFYKIILNISTSKLVESGRIYFEAHVNYAKEVAELMRESGFQMIELKKDISGNNRMVRGVR